MEQVVFTSGDKALLIIEDKIEIGEVTILEEHMENDESFYKVKLNFEISREIEVELIKFFGKLNSKNEYYVCDFELKEIN